MMLSRDEVLDKLSDYLEELFEVPRDKITLDANPYEELDLDSIDAVDLLVKLQALIGRRIQPDEFKSVRTVRDVVDCVEQMLAMDVPAQP
jgi:acyl carrier protein